MNGQLRRTTLFDKLKPKRVPDSGPSRQLVIDSGKYGLTNGGYKAEYLRLTDEGIQIVDRETPSLEHTRVRFELAVKRIEPFNLLYEQLKDKRVPAIDVLTDALASIPQQDRRLCASIFLKNIRDLGLVREVSGAERIITVEQALEELPVEVPGAAPSRELEKAAEAPRGATPSHTFTEPQVHIDINIHIDSSASPEQIDQVFASMARHLYPRQ